MVGKAKKQKNKGKNKPTFLGRISLSNV